MARQCNYEVNILIFIFHHTLVERIYIDMNICIYNIHMYILTNVPVVTWYLVHETDGTQNVLF